MKTTTMGGKSGTRLNQDEMVIPVTIKAAKTKKRQLGVSSSTESVRFRNGRTIGASTGNAQMAAQKIATEVGA
jgi:hypothetical protein